MSKKMLINATLPEEDRVAIVEDGILTELDIEIAGRQQTKSNIYKGEVVRVEQGLQAAFVDYGAQRPGFLQIGEIHPSLYPKRDDDTPHPRRPAITDILKRGQQILVQVVKEERGNKGAALTTEISLPGRYMVLMPESSSRGISRKIDNDSVRKGIKQTMAGLELPENMGYIIRTAAIDQPPEELKRDFDYLLNTYNSIITHNEAAKAPALIYQESNLVIRSIRDYFSTDIDEVLIDDRTVFQEARDFFKAVMPEHASLVKLHQERRPIFARYQIEEQISQLSSNTVNLPSGGSIVLDQTEALVAIDVNSGKMSSEQDVEATAHRVNLEAAVEVARQLRLRDMGGLIVIDFIDMRQRKNAREVEKALKTSLKIDKARVTVGRISHQFGLLEMSRQRIKANLGEGAYRVCSHCQGKGRIQSDESCSVSLLRQIQASTAKGNVSKVSCKAAVDVANYLHNNKRRELHDLEQRYNLTISITADSLFLPEQIELEVTKQSQEKKENRTSVEQGPLVDMDMSLRGQADASSEKTPNTEADSTITVEASETSTDSQETTERKRPRRRRRSNRRRTEEKVEPTSISESTSQPKTVEIAEIENNKSETNNTEKIDKIAALSPDRATENSSTPTTDSSTPTETAAPTTTEENKTVTPVADTAATNKQPEGTVQEETTKKPARRRRAPAKKATSKTESNTDDSVKTDTANTEPVTEKPKRRAPRRKAAPKVAEAENNDQSSTTIATSQEEPNVEPEKKPVRRRRTTKKAAEETSIAEAASTATAEEVKPKRRAPRKKATPAPTEIVTETTEATQTVANDTDSTAEKPVEKKPTRRRRTTKKTPETTTAEVAVTQTGNEEAVTEKPKRPVRRRSTVEKSTKTVEKDDKKETEVKKPVRRRTPRKTAAKEDPAVTDEAKPKRRTSTAKKTSPDVEDKQVDN